MKPHSIGIFDKLYLGSLVVGLANVFVGWETSMAELQATGYGDTFLFVTLAIGYGISLLLWYFISNRASNIARWIFIALTALGLVFLPFSLVDLPMLEMLLAVTVTGMQLVAIYFLFRPDSKLYFENQGQGAVDPSTFE